MNANDLHTKWWQLDAGFRYLRITSPVDAEYGFAFEIEQARLIGELVERNQLKPHGAYNVVCREVTGRKRNITYFPDGSARSWVAEIPDEFHKLPTIEPIVPEASSLTGVFLFLSGVSSGVPDELAQEARIRLSRIEAQRAPIMLPSDLSPMTRKSSSIEEARLQAHRAIVICDFLDTLYAPSGYGNARDEAKKFAVRCKNDYANAFLSGVLYAPLLLFFEILVVADGPYPFGRQRPRFVCGQTSCHHRICNENISLVRAESAKEGVPPVLAWRNVHAYFLRSEAGILEVLDLTAAVAWGACWIEQAAQNLLDRGEKERGKLAQTSSVFDFYTFHYRLLPLLKAAQLGFEYLGHRAAGEAERKRFERLMNKADELAARSIGALSFDFMNAIDLAPSARLRARFLSLAEQSKLSANMLLQKWIYDETIIPSFWGDYVSGKVDGLRFPASARAPL